MKKATEAVLAAINSGEKIALTNEITKRKLRILSTLWNYAIEDGFSDIEKADIAAELLKCC